MSRPRLIARLDIKGDNVVRGIHLEGLRVVGKPEEMAADYCAQGIDELIFIGTVASLYGRNSMLHVVERTAARAFLPLTVGGGIRSVDDAAAALRAGADKVTLNSAAVKRPELLTEIAHAFGSQAVVAALEVKRTGDNVWTVLTENGREPTGKDAIVWAKQVAELGAGEILLTSIDADGTRKGCDLSLIRAVTRAVPIPVIASGGPGKTEHVVAAFAEGGADSLALGSLLHFKLAELHAIRAACRDAGVALRADS